MRYTKDTQDSHEDVDGPGPPSGQPSPKSAATTQFPGNPLICFWELCTFCTNCAQIMDDDAAGNDTIYDFDVYCSTYNTTYLKAKARHWTIGNDPCCYSCHWL